MAYKNPPKETQFTSTNQPANRGRKKGSKNMSTILQEYIDKKIDVKDPITKKTSKKTVGTAIVLKTIAKALKGEDKAIDRIFDRLEGKALQVVEQYAMPVTNEQAMAELIKIAEQEGISIQELCDREGIEFEDDV